MAKLLYITNQICGSGGLERVLSIKASYLAEKLNYEVHIVTLNQGTKSLFYQFSNKLIYHDITTKGVKLNYFLTYKKGIKKVIKKIKPDVISVCDDGLKGLFLPWFLNKPCPMVYERHVSKNIEIKTDKISWLQKIKLKGIFTLMDFGAKKYNKFIVLTKGNLNEWPLSNVQVISNPLSFYPTEFSNVENKKVIAVGKHCHQKGFDRLLQSWKLVTDKFPNWKLEIYGTIEKSEGLLALASKLGIGDKVTFFLPEKNIGEKYKRASIYTMASRYEGFGMVLTEAMAFGVPCVSFNCPYGPSDIIADGEDGFLVPNGDIPRFTEKICELIENQELRRNMGKKARLNVKRYQPEHIVPQWDKLFKQLLVDSPS
ncbi:glycosyltransferase involved in cell wall biosynthesis [Mariniflexile fucanivorans]|uniref:Glycosyltransferase involved in cell wall biosynthesis n=1 Tax=Mariniflexile fucanivorans TaxID=264023 RepID=A0A4R1RGB1_9FLAO|nr:glycosyltransferase family 4 protein [Mariniflexile fucanivorans]TCL65013.1 glycosyltransferase involved in cell wall biosynthesis [Mariniflexile fucanivorans]